MAYEPTNWKTGDVVTSAKLNKLEQAVAGGGGGVFMTPVDTSGANLNIAVKSGDEVFPVQLALISDEDFARLGTSFPIAYKEGDGSIFIPTEYWGESTTITAASEEEASEAGCAAYYTGDPITFPVTYNILVETVSPVAAMTLAPASMQENIVVIEQGGGGGAEGTP